MIGQAGQAWLALAIEDGLGAEVDVVIKKLGDEMTEDVGLIEFLELVAEIEFLDDLADVGRETIQVIGEVGAELFRVGEEARRVNWDVL